MAATGYELHPVDLGIIVTYALLMIGLGLYFGRKHDNATDYFLAGRRMIWPLIGISLFASNVSSTTLVGVAGDAYSTGISVFNYESMAAIVLIFGTFFFFPFLLRAGVYTMPEFLERRYNSKARTYFSLLTLFLNIVVDTATVAAVDAERLLAANDEPENWMSHGRTFDEQRFRPLQQVTTENVNLLCDPQLSRLGL